MSESDYQFNTVEEAIWDIRNGKMVIVVDDEGRENEGDIVVAAQKCTPEIVNFMASHAKGLICMPLTGARLDELKVGQMVQNNTDNHETAFTVSVDYYKTTTGISAFERAATIDAMINPETKPTDLRRPGHIFPLRYREGGVLKRTGHTEASVDLARLAGLYPAAVICEVMNEDGTMARVPQLMKFREEHGLKIITVASLIEYRRHKEKMVDKIDEAQLPTIFGEFKIVAFRSKLDNKEHIALVKGTWAEDEPILVRVHSECLTGDVFGSCRCDCGEQLQEALRMINKEGKGVLLYMRQEGRGIGLGNKIRAYHLQDNGMDTVEANIKLGFPEDLRDYGIGAQILGELGVHKMRLMTNNPKKIRGLEGYDLEVVERVPIQMKTKKENEYYMRTKKEKMGHILDLDND